MPRGQGGAGIRGGHLAWAAPVSSPWLRPRLHPVCSNPHLHPHPHLHPLATTRRGLAEVWQSMQARGDLTPMHFPEAREQAGPHNLKSASPKEGMRGGGSPLGASLAARRPPQPGPMRSGRRWVGLEIRVRPVSDRQALRLLAEHVAEALAGAAPPWQVPSRIHRAGGCSDRRMLLDRVKS